MASGRTPPPDNHPGLFDIGLQRPVCSISNAFGLSSPAMPGSNAHFRKLAAHDYDDVVVLMAELTGDIPLAEGSLGRERFNQILTLDGSAMYGAEVDGTIVSAATLHILPTMTFGGRPYCLVENVVTLRTHQGKGLGGGVMTMVMDAAWAADAYKIMLLTGRTAGAKDFYEKLGFSADSKHGMTVRRAPERQA